MTIQTTARVCLPEGEARVSGTVLGDGSVRVDRAEVRSDGDGLGDLRALELAIAAEALWDAAAGEADPC